MQQGAGPRPFDSTTRRLIDTDPAGWLRWVGLPVDGPVQPVESDVSTVLAEVDKVLRVEGPAPWIAHVEVQSGHDRQLLSRLLQYHALLLHRFREPVASTVVLLRPEADGAELTGAGEWFGPTVVLSVRFSYTVVRLWERPVEEILDGGLGIVPLAPLARVERERVPEVIERMRERFERESTPGEAAELWAATYLLLGLRYDEGEARELLRGVTGMRESATYQAILEEGREAGLDEGRVDEARRLLVRLGSRKFGPPDAHSVSLLDGLREVEVFERLSDRLFDAASWQELLRDADA